MLGPVICGSTTNKKDAKTEPTENNFILDGGSSMRALKFALYALTNNPKILYAPNETQADTVVAKVILL